MRNLGAIEEFDKNKSLKSYFKEKLEHFMRAFQKVNKGGKLEIRNNF